MKISMDGLTKDAINILPTVGCEEARMAISVLHDCLLGILKGDDSIEDVKEFLCIDTDKTDYFGDVVKRR